MGDEMNKRLTVSLKNGEICAIKDIPSLSGDELSSVISQCAGEGMRIVSFFAVPSPKGGGKLFAVLADDTNGVLYPLSSAELKSYPSVTPSRPQAHLFEREIFEQSGITPVGHPWLKPVRELMKNDSFYHIDSDETHEVAVGPVHAGVIEPGHFRFQCYGEKVFHLEIALGYQHRGIENALSGTPGLKTIHYMETLAGDTTIGHSTAYSMIIEALRGITPYPRAEAIRAIALELERIANHIGDLGALAGDIGYLPSKSFCGRLRGDALNMTAEICGNRFGRNLVRPGGVKYDLDRPLIDKLLLKIKEFRNDAVQAAEIMWDVPSVLERFEETGVLTKETAEQIGMVGPSARASGLKRDVRSRFPTGTYRFNHVPIVTYESGDVFARALTREMEINRSIKFIQDILKNPPASPLMNAKVENNAADSFAAAMVEGWRGEICHTAITDKNGGFIRYKVTDPSFHNWFGLACCMKNGAISDFPVCNKSFSLSYCGHDL